MANSGIGAMFVGGGKTYGVVITMDTVLFVKVMECHSGNNIMRKRLLSNKWQEW